MYLMPLIALPQYIRMRFRKILYVYVLPHARILCKSSVYTNKTEDKNVKKRTKGLITVTSHQSVFNTIWGRGKKHIWHVLSWEWLSIQPPRKKTSRLPWIFFSSSSQPLMEYLAAPTDYTLSEEVHKFFLRYVRLTHCRNTCYNDELISYIIINVGNRGTDRVPANRSNGEKKNFFLIRFNKPRNNNRDGTFKK